MCIYSVYIYIYLIYMYMYIYIYTYTYYIYCVYIYIYIYTIYIYIIYLYIYIIYLYIYIQLCIVSHVCLPCIFRLLPCLIDAQARGDGLAGNESIQPHGVDGVLSVFLEIWRNPLKQHPLSSGYHIFLVYIYIYTYFICIYI